MENFMEFYIRAVKKYAEFQGVDNRREFWMFALVHFIIIIVLSFVAGMIGLGILATIYSLALLVPSLAASVRRLRDAGFNPLLILIALIPLIGGIILLVLLAQPTKAQAAA